MMWISSFIIIYIKNKSKQNKQPELNRRGKKALSFSFSILAYSLQD